MCLRAAIGPSEATMSDRRYGPDEHNADYERGREDERAAIVAWLRYVPAWDTDTARLLIDVADQVERGDHLGGDDE